MKEETRKRREKIKNQLMEFQKEVKKSTRGKKEKLSVAQMNKAIMNAMSAKNKENDDEEIAEEKEETKVKRVKHREFRCKCGVMVTLHGEAEADCCSKCVNE